MTSRQFGLDLPLSPYARAQQLYARLLKIFEQVSSGPGKDNVAAAIKMKGPTFSNALKDRNYNAFKGLQLLALLIMDQGNLALEEIANEKDKTLHDLKPLSDRELLDELTEYVLQRHGEAGAETVRKVLARRRR